MFGALKISATIAFSADIFWYIGIGFPGLGSWILEMVVRVYPALLIQLNSCQNMVIPIYYPPLLAYIKVFIGSHPNQLLLPSVILIIIFLMEVYLFSFSIQLYFKYVLCTCYTCLNG